jgi:aldehyde dehydrogenase (NAD+)
MSERMGRPAESAEQETVSQVEQEVTPYEGFESMPIGGSWREGRTGKSAPVTDPYTGETLVEISLADADDLDEAYRAAQEAQKEWAALLPQERAGTIEQAASILEQRKEEVIHWLIREAGSTRGKAELEWGLVYAGMKEAATYPMHITGQILPGTIPGKENRVYRDPVGVIGVISPWNFPLQLTNRSIAPAFATGNAVVVKPDSETPITGALLLAKVYEEAGLPPGVLNVVIGAGRDIGDPFVEHPIPRVISFTGSTSVGSHIGELCGRHVKRVCLELGGNSPFVVLDDADLDLAVDAAVVGKFTHQGQMCIAINRILVDESVHDDFLERFTQRVAELKVGNPAEPDTVVGPIINESQIETIQEKVQDTVDAGARMELGGEVDGLVMHPVVLSGVTQEMRAAKEELFGPVAPILKVSGEEDAIHTANATVYGLSSAVFTRNGERGVRVAKRIEAGMTHVNDITANDEPNTAFGGEKKSGLGRFGGHWALEEFTTDRWISVQEEPRPYPF